MILRRGAGGGSGGAETKRAGSRVLSPPLPSTRGGAWGGRVLGRQAVPQPTGFISQQVCPCFAV